VGVVAVEDRVPRDVVRGDPAAALHDDRPLVAVPERDLLT
jgi:hypothetical protein